MPGSAIDTNNNSINMEEMKCHSEWLEEELQKESQMLIIDYRANEDYRKSHVKGALHIGPVPGILQKRFEKNRNVVNLLKSDHKDKYTKHKEGVIVVYDNEGFTSQTNNDFFHIFLKGLVENGGKVQLLTGGFQEFFRKYPNHCSQYDTNNENHSEGDGHMNHLIQGVGQLDLSSRMAEIITHNHYCKTTQPNDPPVQVVPHVFLGNYYNAKDSSCLDSNNIMFILNVTNDLDNVFEGKDRFQYHRVPILDRSSQELLPLLPAAFEFIDSAVNSQSGVLIHCFAGVSRSATVTIAYLMRRRCMSFDNAHSLVSEKRTGISPNIHFLMQLKEMSTSDISSPVSTTATTIIDRGCDSLVNSPAALDSPASYGNNSISSLSPSPCLIGTSNTCTEDVDSAVDSGGSSAVFFTGNSSAATSFSSTSSTCTTPSPLTTDYRHGTDTTVDIQR